MKPIYLDYQASTPMDKLVIEEMLPYFCEIYGNPSSSHRYGIEANMAVNNSREIIANMLGVKSHEIYFTSGSTESNNLSIKGVAGKPKDHIITVCTEHKSILSTCMSLEKEGINVTYLQVDRHGFIDANQLKNAITSNTRLISVMYGNNEAGTMQAIDVIGKIAKEHNIIFHCDATQAIAYEKINVLSLNIDILNFSSHKIYGPKGIGGMYVNDKIMSRGQISAQIHGGGQERHLRGGTLNVPAIVGMGKAVQLLIENQVEDTLRIRSLQKLLWDNISSETDCVLNGSFNSRLPNNLNICFPRINGQRFLQRIDHLAISSGSACNSNLQEPSHVLSAMGLTKDQIQASFRLSIGRYTTQEEIELASTSIVKAFKAAI